MALFCARDGNLNPAGAVFPPPSAASREPRNVNEERITDVLMLLRSPGLPKNALAVCLDGLLASTPDESSWTFARAAGAYEAVVAAMRAHAGDAVLQSRVCFWLMRFGLTVPPNVPATYMPQSYFPAAFAFAARAGAIEAIVAAMRRHPRAPRVLLNGCSALICLTTDAQEGQHIAADAGALEAVLCALRMGDIHDGVATPAAVSQTACYALYSMINGWANSAGAASVRLAAAARADIFDALFSAMRAHPSVAALQGSACMALDIIAYADLPPAAAAAAARGVALIVSALTTHAGVEAVQCAGIRAITYIMVDNEEAQQRAADAGAIRWVVTCLRGGGGGGGNDAAEQLVQCCEALVAWTENSADNRTKCVAAGAIEAVVAAMRECDTHALLQIAGCDALYDIIDSDSTPHQTRAAAAGAIEAVVRALQTHAADVQMQSGGLQVLLQLCFGHSANCRQVVAAWPTVLQAMQTHADDANAAELQLDGCRILLYSYLALEGDHRSKAQAAQRLVSLGALEVVSRALLTHSSALFDPAPLLLLNLCSAGEYGLVLPVEDDDGAATVLKYHGARAARAGAAAALRAAVVHMPQDGDGALGDVPAAGGAVTEAKFARELRARSIQLADALDALPRRACDGCGATDAPTLKTCGRCRAARFCSVACQRAAWGTHRLVCVPPAAAAATTEDAAAASGSG
jgi:hypothetical protein